MMESVSLGILSEQLIRHIVTHSFNPTALRMAKNYRVLAILNAIELMHDMSDRSLSYTVKYKPLLLA